MKQKVFKWIHSRYQCCAKTRLEKAHPESYFLSLAFIGNIVFASNRKFSLKTLSDAQVAHYRLLVSGFYSANECPAEAIHCD